MVSIRICDKCKRRFGPNKWDDKLCQECIIDICAGCKKPIDTKPLVYSPYNKRGVTTNTIKCHPTSKCVDMLSRVTESDRTMMKRVIELSREEQ